MNKVEQINSVVTEFEGLQKNVDLVVNELFPELRGSRLTNKDEVRERFFIKAKESLDNLKHNVANLEKLLEEEDSEKSE